LVSRLEASESGCFSRAATRWAGSTWLLWRATTSLTAVCRASLDLVVICASIRISFVKDLRWNQLSKRTTPTKLSLFHSTLNSEVAGSAVTGSEVTGSTVAGSGVAGSAIADSEVAGHAAAVDSADDHGLEVEAAQHPIGDLRVSAAFTAGAQHLGAGGLH